MNIHKAHEDSRRQLRLQTQGEPANSDGDRLAVLDQDEVDAEGGAERAVEEVNNEKEEKVTWMSLPHKKQLIVLTLARLSEPLVQTSLQASRIRSMASGYLLMAVFYRHTCSISSSPSMNPFQTLQSLHKQE